MACVFAGTCLLVVAASLRGGSYSLIARQEIGLGAWWILGVGLALGLLPRRRPAGAALLPLAALAAYAAWTGLSLAWSESAELTWAELARVTSYLGVCALLLAALDARTWRAAIAGAGCGAIIVCVLAVISRLDPRVFPVDQAARAFQADRLDYPFGYWNAVGAWGAMATAFALAFATHASSRAARCLALALAPVCCLTTYLSYSRAGYAALVVGVAVVVGLGRHRLLAAANALIAGAGTAIVVVAVRGAPEIAKATGTRGVGSIVGALVFAGGLGAVGALAVERAQGTRWRLPPSVSRIAAVLAAAVILVVAIGFGPHLASHAWRSFKNTDTRSTALETSRVTSLSGTRYNLWRVALEAFSSEPATGSGAGTYRFQWARRQRDAESVINAHSLWLENLSDLGIPGLALVIATVAAFLVAAGRARRAARRSASAGAVTAAISMFVVFLLTASADWMWQSTAVALLALVVVVAASARGQRRPVHLPVGARLCAAAGCIALAAVQVPGLLSTAEVHRSQAAFRVGHLPTASAWANDAVSAMPWSASAIEQRALIEEAEGRLSAAARDEHRATVDEPTSYAHWLIAARLEAERGRYAAAAADLLRARSLGRLERVFVWPTPGPQPTR